MLVRKHRILMLLSCLPMIHGCAAGGSSKAVDLGPVVVDTAKLRCPPIAAADMKEFRRWVDTPNPDTLTSEGKPAYSLSALQEWLDRYERAEWRKNKAGQRIARELKSCRDPAPQVAMVN